VSSHLEAPDVRIRGFCFILGNMRGFGQFKKLRNLFLILVTAPLFSLPWSVRSNSIHLTVQRSPQYTQGETRNDSNHGGFCKHPVP